MPDDAAAVFGHHRVERVAGLHVHEVGPCAEHLERTQLAPVLVRHDVVGIVRARAVVAEAANRAPRQAARRDGAIAAVRAPVRPREDGVEIVARHRACPPRLRSERGRPGNVDLVAAHRDEMVLDLPVAERPENLVGDEDGGGRRLGEAGRVKRDEPQLAAGVAHGEPGRKPRLLGRHDHPAPRRRPAAALGPDGGFVDCHRPRHDAVGEPARVRHLVDGVHVAGAHVERLVAGASEQVYREIDQQLDIPLCNSRSVLRLRFPLQRVVVVKAAIGRR